MTIAEIESSRRYAIHLIPELARWTHESVASLEVQWDGDYRFDAWVDGKPAGHLVLTDEGDGLWVDQASVRDSLQSKGIGTALVALAVGKYDIVYASSTSALHDGDTRYVSTEGAALVRSCIRKGIMKAEWSRNPAEDEWE